MPKEKIGLVWFALAGLALTAAIFSFAGLSTVSVPLIIGVGILGICVAMFEYLQGPKKPNV